MKLLKSFVCILVIFFSLSLVSFAQGQKPVDPVNWRELVPFLVDIQGWDAEGKPEGSSISMGNYKVSKASREYSSGDKDLEIEIIDGGFVPMIYAGIKMAMSFEIDTSDEYLKKITIKNCPGVEKYQYGDKEAEVIILIAERFLVTLKGDNFKDTKELKDIAEILDLDGIAALGK